MARHGEMTVELPATQAFRNPDGTLSANPKVFIHLRDLEQRQIVTHEINFALARHINVRELERASAASGWSDLVFSERPHSFSRTRRLPRDDGIKARKAV